MVPLVRILFVFVFFIKYSFSDNYIVNNKRFPSNFKFGVATSAVQIEGGWNADGKGENIWDHISHTNPAFIKDRKNADIACNSYELYENDITILKELGVDYYRFSLSWTRILPRGTKDYINQAGVKYYKNLLKRLKENHIKPLVTLFHWDTPQVIEEQGGWINESIIERYADYADLCFKFFGDDVQLWTTFNEPKQTCLGGYGYGYMAPAIKHEGVLDYVCAHNVLKAHARAWHLYDEKYRPTQKGNISIVIDTSYFHPLTNSTDDLKARQTTFDFELGWFADPVFLGDYPETMKTRIAKRSKAEAFKRSRLPQFSAEEIGYIRGTGDYFAVNTYSSSVVESIPEPRIMDKPSRRGDMGVGMTSNSSWPKNSMGWAVVPWGMRKLLKYIKDKYNDPVIVVTENGYSDTGGLEDNDRLNYVRDYLSNVRDAIEYDHVKIVGYTLWSSMDNFEWAQGFSQKFGLYHVDFDSRNKTRTPKKSGKYYAKVTRTRCLVEHCVD